MMDIMQPPMNTESWFNLRMQSTGVAVLLQQWGIASPLALAAERLVIVALIVIAALVANFVARRLIVRVLHSLFRRTQVTWDDRIAERGVLLRLSRVAPAMIVYAGATLVAPETAWVSEAIRRGASAWVVLIAALTIASTIDVFHDLYRASPVARQRPIKGFVQLAKVVLLIVAAVIILTTILNQSPLGILSGLGAMSAVLLLIFRDSILGFVSGIQLSANNMVQIGDWIEMPKYDADGDVIDITLQTIKVQNWDKTITTIPIYALVSDSFRNWRGMTESGGRRIKRAISIDMRSVRFVDQQMLDSYRRFSRIRDYIDRRQAEIDAYNSEHHIELADCVSGRRMTNLGIFRAYVTTYLQQHPMIRKDMTFLVRQLPPGPTGIPIEVFVFSADQRWPNYEGIQADIFDHLLAVIPEFDLRVYQEPSGYELDAIARALRDAKSAD
ncbi:MAG: mechanosensitive ion channel family protein [Spirochaetaceae bacterium]|nr:MAG: mechanosensitive ion channel family protein [Spirochaetaceae bacterium]